MHTHAAIAPMAAKPLPKVRLAVPSDFNELMEIGYELHAENSVMPVNDSVVQQVAHNAVNHIDGVCGVIGDHGPIEAVIMLQLRKFWYSDDVHLEEMLCYVRPEYRRSDNAKALIEFAKGAALRMDVPLLIGIISNKQTAQKIRLYERRLGKIAGAYFLFNGKTGV